MEGKKGSKTAILVLVIVAALLVMLSIPVFAQNSNNQLSMIALVLDTVLVGGVLSLYLGDFFEGKLKKAFFFVFVAIFIFAVNHLIETLLLFAGVEHFMNEIIHRGLHLIALGFLFYGFYRVNSICKTLPKKYLKG